MTNQEAFDISAAHLLRQGKKSLVNGGWGQLRGHAGAKCALGALVPDEEYTAELELHTHDLPRYVPSLRGLDPSLLTALRRLHDSWEVSRWREELRCIAHMFSLDAHVLS